MRKHIKVLVVISLIFLLCSFISIIYASSKNNVTGGFISEFQQPSQKIIKNNISNIKNLTLNSENLDLKYQYSLKYDAKEIDIYTDIFNTEYALNGNSLLGFIKDADTVKISALKSDSSLTHGQILDVAINYLSKNLSNFNEYELVSINYVSSYNEYTITYMNKCCGYKTLDVAEVNITPVGEIVSFYANNQKIMSQYENSNISINQAETNEFIEKSLSDKYSYIPSYEIEDKILTIIDNKLAVQYYLSMELQDGYNDSEILI